MQTASAVTGENGLISMFGSLKTVDQIGDYRVPKSIDWGKGKSMLIGDLYSDNKWSLLISFIINTNKSITMRTGCIKFMSTKRFGKIEVDGFEYIEKGKRITRRKIK